MSNINLQELSIKELNSLARETAKELMHRKNQDKKLRKELAQESNKSFKKNDSDVSERVDTHIDEEWMSKLWKWADDNEIHEFYIPRNESQLFNLTTLDLQHQKLTSIPSEIGCLTKLTSLNLSNNALDKLPIEISRLKELITLNLSYNKFRRKPKEIESLKNIKTLSLNDNNFKQQSIEVQAINYFGGLYSSI